MNQRSDRRSIGPLREGTSLGLDEGACLPLRSRFGQCSACASACPVGVLRVSIDAVRLDDGCIGCARCVAACPVEALHFDGLDAIFAAPVSASQSISIECQKVPRELCAPDAIRVPCLGSLSVGRLLALRERSPQTPVTVVDRGWCEACEANVCASRGPDASTPSARASGSPAAERRADHPASTALDTARLWLEQLGVPDAQLPRLEARPLDVALMPATIPPGAAGGATAERAGDRRAFLRAIVEGPARRQAPTPMGGNGRAAHPPSARRASPERQRQLAALSAEAARQGRQVPGEFFPRITSNGRCNDHRVCVAACPTGALKVTEFAGGAALEFSAQACIACGSCARSCPEEALSLAAHSAGEEGAGREPVTLVRHEHRACAECGASFAAADDEVLCSSCRKARRFMKDAMKQLFGNR